MLGHIVGLVKVRVLRGVNLAIRDLCSSDPYVVVRMGKQKLKTRVIKKSINPEWNDELTLSVEDPAVPVRVCWKVWLSDLLERSSETDEWPAMAKFMQSSLASSVIDTVEVFDKDTFIDDPMGNAELDIRPLVEVVKMKLQDVADNTVVKKLVPNRQNCLAEESAIYISEGKVTQDLVLRLRNVESGEIELQLHWIDVPGSKGV